jgi:hypothetical protein
LQGTAAYTWSHSIDNGSFDSGLYLAASQLPPSSDHGPSSFDVRHNLVLRFTYNPLRNWDLSAMVRARTGFPIDVLTTQNFLGLGFDDITRPNIVPGVPLWLPSADLGGRRLNPAAFATPARVQGTGPERYKRIRHVAARLISGTPLSASRTGPIYSAGRSVQRFEPH